MKEDVGVTVGKVQEDEGRSYDGGEQTSPRSLMIIFKEVNGLASLKREKSKRCTFICFIAWKIEEIETPNLIPILKKRKNKLW